MLGSRVSEKETLRQPEEMKLTPWGRWLHNPLPLCTPEEQTDEPKRTHGRI